MAMAAVRLAARRLTGQQPQAILRSALANEQTVLNRGSSPAYALRRRFTSSEASAANAPKISTEHPSVSSGDSRLMAAHQKKVELFYMLAEIQTDNSISYARRLKDRLVLHRLTSIIDIPNNPDWHWYHQEYGVFQFLRGTIAFFGTIYYYEKWGDFHNWRKPVQGADSNSKASVSCAEPNSEE
ncbi:hypothetical protein ACQ4PT_052322 [Festuca glaucescens]